MPYDFSVLDDKDFEKLCRDILNAKFSFDLQDFKPGKDKGRDLRYSTPANSDSVIVQAKHYLKSGLKALLRDLENKELEKVVKLKPERYLLVTSVSLSAANKDEIVKLFSPYIKTANDVFGQEDLNKYISELPELETRWYKLWLSSTNVLQTILNNAVKGRSAFVESKIQRTIKLYVHCQSYDEAFDILAKHKYILITGQPGVGKTTLAYLLSYNLMSKNHQLIYIDSDVRDAEDMWNPDPAVKQFFFFDDFLGATYLEITNPKTTESAFVNFLDRIKNSEGRYLILTTRTSIFRNALDKYEKMKRIKVDIARKEIELGQYSILDKARILYKHFYHSDLSNEQKSEILTDKSYWRIIDHRNYNPRLIEFITDPRNIPDTEKNSYMRFVINNLENPQEVWRHCYLEQLTVEEKILLHAVYSQKHSSRKEDTKLLFDRMLDHEAKQFNHRPIVNPFYTSLKKLLDGILKLEIHSYSKTDVLNFINPSLQDFLTNYFVMNEEDRWKLIKGSYAIEQFERYAQSFFNYSNTSLPNISTESSRFANFLMDSSENIISYQELKREKNRTHYTQLRIAALLNGLVSLDEQTSLRIEEYSLKVITSYKISDLTLESREYYYNIVRYYLPESAVSNYVTENWDDIIKAMFATARTDSNYEQTKALFDEYDQNYDVFIKNRYNANVVSESLAEYINESTNDWIKEENGQVYSEKDWEKLKDNIKEKRDDLFAEYGLEDEDYFESDYFDDEMAETLIERNINRKNAREESSLVNTQKYHSVADENNVKEVELLFTGEYDSEFVASKADEINLPF